MILECSFPLKKNCSVGRKTFHEDKKKLSVNGQEIPKHLLITKPNVGQGETSSCTSFFFLLISFPPLGSSLHVFFLLLYKYFPNTNLLPVSVRTSYTTQNLSWPSPVKNRWHRWRQKVNPKSKKNLVLTTWSEILDDSYYFKNQIKKNVNVHRGKKSNRKQGKKLHVSKELDHVCVRVWCVCVCLKERRHEHAAKDASRAAWSEIVLNFFCVFSCLFVLNNWALWVGNSRNSSKYRPCLKARQSNASNRGNSVKGKEKQT